MAKVGKIIYLNGLDLAKAKYPKYMTRLFLYSIISITCVVSICSCRFLEEKQKESDAKSDSISFKEQLLDAQLEPINPEIMKHLLQMKHLLPKPIKIPVNSFERENPIVDGVPITDPCYDTPERKKVLNGCDYTSTLVRNTSIQIAANNPGQYNIGQLCDLFDYTLKNWTYINDPIQFNYVAKASESIEQNYTGDCDDFAVLIGSMIMSIGGEVRLNYAWNDSAGHAFVEANLGRVPLTPIKHYIRQRYGLLFSDVVYLRRDLKTQNVWLNMDWFAKHPGGPYYGHHHGIRFFIAYRHCESFEVAENGTIKVFEN
ncbi:MAG: hypothetical protein KC517_00580 [Bacteroidetes bacterium]|jgi:hypothetical protein|nr:hypothetical protein [Bacteroidota bacterium]